MRLSPMVMKLPFFPHLQEDNNQIVIAIAVPLIKAQ